MATNPAYPSLRGITRMGVGTPKDRTTPGTWLGGTLRRFNILAALRENRHLKRTCRECLQLYRGLGEHPTATARERYALVVKKRTGADASGADTILQRAEESFAAWPIERPLTFRDVVHYLAVTECLSDDRSLTGVRTDVTMLVAKLIPANL
jgi:hypothetical protein